jgi:hypothetical protein
MPDIFFSFYKLEIIKKYCDASAKISHFFVPGKDHSMPKSQLEWRAIHTYFSINLSRRNIELENMSDVYLVSKWGVDKFIRWLTC